MDDVTGSVPPVATQASPASARTKRAPGLVTITCAD
jgi:hypothetical protein